MKSIAGILPLLASASLVIGCANSSARYEPIIDGETNVTYSTDLSECQTLATQRKFDNGDVRSAALADAMLGSLLGASEGVEGAFAGAAAGSLLGGAERAWQVRDERKAIVVKCLENRGHNVVG